MRWITEQPPEVAGKVLYLSINKILKSCEKNCVFFKTYLPDCWNDHTFPEAPWLFLSHTTMRSHRTQTRSSHDFIPYCSVYRLITWKKYMFGVHCDLEVVDNFHEEAHKSLCVLLLLSCKTILWLWQLYCISSIFEFLLAWCYTYSKWSINSCEINEKMNTLSFTRMELKYTNFKLKIAQLFFIFFISLRGGKYL